MFSFLGVVFTGGDALPVEQSQRHVYMQALSTARRFFSVSTTYLNDTEIDLYLCFISFLIYSILLTYNPPF